MGRILRRVELVQAFAKEFGLTVESSSKAGPCTVRLSGSVAAMEKAFGVTLKTETTAAGTFRVREGAIYLPEELDGQVVAVLGLDNRPQARPHFRIAQPKAVNVSYTPVQVGALYGFPAAATAKGQTIGLIELGGGFREADVTAYFKTLGLPAPAMTAVSVDGGKNTPGTAERSGWRGDAGHRGVRVGCDGSEGRGVFCAEYGPGIHRRGVDGGA